MSVEAHALAMLLGNHSEQPPTQTEQRGNAVRLLRFNAHMGFRKEHVGIQVREHAQEDG